MREPFVRLELRRFTGQMGNKLQGDLRVVNDVEPKVTLLIHRSGVALLTFGVRLPENSTADQLIPLLASSGTAFYSVVLADPILRNASEYGGAKEKFWPGEWLPDIEEGTRWRKFDDGEDPGSLTDIFRLYQDAILNQLPRREVYSDWLSYPTIFFEDLRCCGSRARWMGKHWVALASLLGRASLGDGLSEKAREEILNPDHSLTRMSSLWTPGGSTVEVMWNFYAEPDRTANDYLMRLTVSENAILRFWQLRTLDYYVARAEPRRKDLEALLVSAINGMREYRRSYLSYGTAQDISDRIAERLGENTVLESVNMQLATLQQLVSMKESVKASRRANQFASAAMLAAFLLGLPAIKQSLEVLQKIPNDGPFGLFSSFVVGMGSTLDAAALKVYLICVVLAVILLAFGRMGKTRRMFRRSQSSEMGVRWGKEVTQIEQRQPEQWPGPLKD